MKIKYVDIIDKCFFVTNNKIIVTTFFITIVNNISDKIKFSHIWCIISDNLNFHHNFLVTKNHNSCNV